MIQTAPIIGQPPEARDVRVTANFYSQLMEQTAARAAQHMDALLKAGK